MPNNMDSFKRLILLLFKDVSFILLCIIFPDFKVLDIVLDIVIHGFLIKKCVPTFLEEVFFHLILFNFSFFFREWLLLCTLWYCCDRNTRHASRKTQSALPGWCWVTATCFCENPWYKDAFWGSFYIHFYIFIYFYIFQILFCIYLCSFLTIGLQL
jgi:hypothetical protein